MTKKGQYSQIIHLALNLQNQLITALYLCCTRALWFKGGAQLGRNILRFLMGNRPQNPNCLYAKYISFLLKIPKSFLSQGQRILFGRGCHVCHMCLWGRNCHSNEVVLTGAKIPTGFATLCNTWLQVFPFDTAADTCLQTVLPAALCHRSQEESERYISNCLAPQTALLRNLRNRSAS